MLALDTHRSASLPTVGPVPDKEALSGIPLEEKCDAVLLEIDSEDASTMVKYASLLIAATEIFRALTDLKTVSQVRYRPPISTASIGNLAAVKYEWTGGL